jgi:hypothetical protein
MPNSPIIPTMYLKNFVGMKLNDAGRLRTSNGRYTSVAAAMNKYKKKTEKRKSQKASKTRRNRR